MRTFHVLAVAVLLAAAVVVSAEEIPTGAPGATVLATNGGAVSDTTRPREMDTYGTAGWVQVNYATTDFTPLMDGEWAHSVSTSGWSYRSGGTNSATCTGIHIPSGANWTGVSYWLYDVDAAQNITLEIFEIDLVSHTSTTLYTVASTGSGGQQQAYQDFAAAETVENERQLYTACHLSSVTNNNLRHAGLTVWYKLQVSPAPGVATFADVPTGHPYFRFVEALYASGITGGCGGGNYCPNNTLTRGEMAVFLSAALGLHWPDN